MTIKLCLIYDTDMRGLHDVVCGLVHGEMTVHGSMHVVCYRRCVRPLPSITVGSNMVARPRRHRAGACGSIGKGDETLCATLVAAAWSRDRFAMAYT